MLLRKMKLMKLNGNSKTIGESCKSQDKKKCYVAYIWRKGR